MSFGALIGETDTIILRKCAFNGDIRGTAGSNSSFGGLVGIVQFNGDVSDCQVLGNVSFVFKL